MNMKQHLRALKNKLAAYDKIEATREAVLNDSEIQDLFEKEDDNSAYALINKKYGAYPSIDESNKALVELMQVIFSKTHLAGKVNFKLVISNYKVCMEAIKTSREMVA